MSDTIPAFDADENLIRVPAKPTLTFAAFAAKYCDRQDQTPDGLRDVLIAQWQRYENDGWMLLECHMMDGSRLGELTILPYGPNNTYKTVPNHPVSPRGLASDMSTVVAVLLRSALAE